MRKLLTVAIATVCLSASAAAKLGTGEPHIWIGEKMAYGSSLQELRECQQSVTYCRTETEQAQIALETWNRCLDRVLSNHGITLMWPIPATEQYLPQMEYRSMLIEDLFDRGGYLNEMTTTCLPDQNIVLP